MQLISRYILVAIDLSAAFDTVDHDILIDILNKQFGIERKVLDWCASYLRDRQLKVYINNTYSDVKTFNYSVPQGSCNGTSYFCLYSSSLQYHLSDAINLSAFADDHTLYNNFKPQYKKHVAVLEMETNLAEVQRWMNLSRLKMNAAKTELIYTGSRQQLDKSFSSSIKVGTDTISKSDHIRLLGVWLDKNLSFEVHCKKK